MVRPNKKVTTRVTEDDPPTVEDQSLEKDTPQDPNSSKASEAEDQRLKELKEQVIHLDEPNSATKASQEKNSQKSLISIDTSSPLSINL